MDDLYTLLGGLRISSQRRAAQPRPPARGTHAEGPLVIGDRQFRSKDEAWDHIADIKQRLLGVYAGPEHGDFEFLSGLLARHPKGAAKVEHPPVRHFTARTNVSGRGTEFRFVDSAGEEHDFSAKKCMDHTDWAWDVKLRRAMELAVEGQAEAFCLTAEQECELCADTGSRLVVDQDPALPHLCAAFLRSHPAMPAPRHFAESPSGGAQLRAEDASFEAAWQDYYAEHAHLRMLCEHCQEAENARRGVRTRHGGVFTGGRGRGGTGGRSGGHGGGRGGSGRGGSAGQTGGQRSAQVAHGRVFN